MLLPSRMMKFQANPSRKKENNSSPRNIKIKKNSFT